MAKANLTRCQDPIAGFEVSYAATDTYQQSNWGETIYLAVGEMLNVIMNTTEGNPITYAIDWNVDGGDSLAVTIEEDQGTLVAFMRLVRHIFV